MLFSDLISEDKNEVSMNFPEEIDQNPFSEARFSGPPISLAFLSWLLHILAYHLIRIY